MALPQPISMSSAAAAAKGGMPLERARESVDSQLPSAATLVVPAPETRILSHRALFGGKHD
jgi:hypothetical protein